MGVQFAGNILVQANGGPLPISQGGTGQTTAPTAINALLPTQTGNSGKVLTTNGTNVSWAAGGVTAGGSDTQIQFNDSGSLGGLASLVINKTTGALTGTSTFTNIGTNITGAAATIRPLKFQTAGSDRWLMQANATAESGSAAGSNFEFVRVADNGATTNQVFTVARNSGVVDFKATPTVNGVAIGTGSGTVTSVAVSSSNAALSVSGSPITSNGTISLTANTFTTSNPGVVPASGGGTTNFLRADGTWAAAGGTPAGSNTQIQYNNSGAFGASSSFAWDNSATTLTLGPQVGASGGTVTVGPPDGSGIGTGTSVLIKATSTTNNFSSSAGSITLQAGSLTGDNGNGSSQGGSINISAGNSVVSTFNTGTGGNVIISGGLGITGSTLGYIAFKTGITGSLTERFRILNNGAWSVGSAGTNTGTSGQVLTSTGSTTAPTWQDAGAAAGALTGTTLAANVVSSSLTSVGTITSGTWSGSFGAVSGANLTTLNASNLSSGTVGTARMGSGTANSTTYLRGDGTWATPAGSGTVTSVAVSSANGAITISGSPITSAGTISLTANTFTTSVAGVVPASGGGTTNFLRADGTWTAPTTSPALTATFVGYGNGSNVLTGTSNFTFNNSTNTLSIGTLITTPSVINAADVGSGSTAAPSLTVRGGDGNSSNVNAGALILRGGNYTSTNIGTGANIQVLGGSATGAGTGNGGNVIISGGTTAAGTTGGFIQFNTTATTGAVAEKFRITPAGAWSTGATGTATGTANAPLLSAGSAAVPTWATSFLWDGTNRVMNLGGSGTNSATISTPDQTTAVNSSALTIRGGDNTSTGVGGAVTIRGGNATSVGSGALNLLGGTGGTVGGAVTITAGVGTTTNGAISVSAGSSTGTNAGGAVTISAGAQTGSSGNGGNLTISAGSVGNSSTGGTGGTVAINAGSVGDGFSGPATAAGAINITAGSNGQNTANGGSISITAGSGSNGGTLTLTAGSAGTLGGNLVLNAGNGVSTGGPTGGDIVFTSGNGTARNERFRINNNGGWILNTVASTISGQYLRTSNTSSGVTWGTIGTAPSNLALTQGTYIGTNSTWVESAYVNTTPAVDNRIWTVRNTNAGLFQIVATDDAFSPTTAALSITRSGTSVTSIAFTGTAMTASGTFQATTVNVTGATAPANGMYLAAANSVAFSTNTTESIRIDSTGNLLVQRVGSGLRVKEGTNAKMGVSTLVGGTVVVSNTSVTANSRIFLTTQSVGGTAGFLVVSARTAGTSFTILSSSATDTSVVAWMIVEPA